MILVFVAGLFACRSRAGLDDKQPMHASKQPAQLLHATQQDLAQDLDDADRRGTWSEVRTKWQGQRVTWTVTRNKLLCSSTTSCHVNAFAISRPAQRGWLPGLALTESELAKIDAGCGAAETCELVFEGTLSELAVSPELPTSLAFTDVRVLKAGAT